MDGDFSEAEPLSRLLLRFGVAKPLHGEEIVSVSLALALATGNDPLRLLDYLAGIGIVVSTLEDLLRINDVADEEELSAHRVAEGIALSVASEGEWVLFRP